MKWVSSCERMPSRDDATSVDSDGDVFVIWRHGNKVSVSICNFANVSSDQYWLEGWNVCEAEPTPPRDLFAEMIQRQKNMIADEKQKVESESMLDVMRGIQFVLFAVAILLVAIACLLFQSLKG